MLEIFTVTLLKLPIAVEIQRGCYCFVVVVVFCFFLQLHSSSMLSDKIATHD